MAMFAELELAVRRVDAGSYLVDLKSYPVTIDGDERQSGKIQLDVEALKTLPTADDYGKVLGQALFVDELHDAFTRARTLAQTAGASLRIRLVIDDEAPELHAVRWETLRDRAGAELFNGETLWFSRYLSSSQWKAVSSRPQSGLRGLVMIANPSELAQNPAGLAPIPVEENLTWANASLNGINLTHLISGAEKPEDRPTLSNLQAQLRNPEPFDILFLICHGALGKPEQGGQPRLWLENDQGKADVVPAAALVDSLQRLPALPRLIVLASCQSAGSGASESALTALGPKLAEAGVPAVVAMQGKVDMDTIKEFMPVFFTELRVDGQIDRAMAVARGQAVSRKRKDYWMPVLFMRLRSGSLWYKPGFGANPSGASEFQRWAAIKGAIEDRQCTPILGPGLVEGLLGSSRELARQLAASNKFPMSPGAIEDMPTVAQYLAVQQGTTIFPRRAMRKSMERDLTKRYGPQLDADVDPSDISALISASGKLERKSRPAEPHRVLASKPFSIYITVNPDTLMEDALTEAGRTPRSDFARWNEKIADLRKFPILRDREPDYRPNVKNPLVYHLYGLLSIPESLVVTEDDYFDYLLRIGSKADGKNLIPGPVGTALTADALLFIGFGLDDWGFRVLLRSIYSKEGSGARSIGNDTLPCVGAQITPEEDRILRPDGARKYFEQYLRSTNIDIYWGRVDDFIADLDKQTADLNVAGAAA